MDKSVDWADLPPELCRMICKHLNSKIDFLRFRSICKSWRSSLYPTHTPSRIITTRFGKRRLTRTTIYHLELSDPAITLPSSSFSKAWLIKVEESEYTRLHLLNPFTNDRLSSSDTRYPSDSFRKVLNMLNFRFIELMKTYSVSLHGSGGMFHPLESGKVVAFSNFAWTKIENLMLFSVHRDGKLGFSKIGDDKWTLVDGDNFYYDDIIVHKGRLYVVDRCGTISSIELIDCSSFKLVQFSPPFCSLVNNNKKHLVESCGSLYVVDVHFEGDPNNLKGMPYEVLGLKAYKLDEGWGKWLEVNNLDERAFVLSQDCNFSLLAHDYQGCERDCIYFCDRGSVFMFNLRTSTLNFPMAFWPCPTLFDLCIFPKRKHCPKLDESVDWSDLLPELWAMIGEHLNSKINLCQFRSVCKSWHSSVSPSCTVSPVFPPRITSPFGECWLVRSTIYRLELSDLAVTFPSCSLPKAWLIKVDDSKYTHRRLCLLNPFTNDRLSSSNMRYPSSSFPKELNMLNFRFVELMKTYSISLHDSGQRLHPHESGKAVAFPNFAWTKIENCMFFSVHRDGKLGFSKIGDYKWTLMDDKNFYYDDIIVHKGQLYVVDRWGIISWVDCSSLKLVQFSPPFCVTVDNDNKKYLVESRGSLYVVDMYFEGDPNNLRGTSYDVCGLKVYLLDEEWGRWLDVKNLEDRAFVLSKDCNFSLSAHDYHGCEENCIYFYDRGSVSMFDLRTSRFNRPKVFWPCPSLFDLRFFCIKKGKHWSDCCEGSSYGK